MSTISTNSYTHTHTHIGNVWLVTVIANTLFNLYRSDQKSVVIYKFARKSSEAVNRRRSDNTMGKRKRTEEKAYIY